MRPLFALLLLALVSIGSTVAPAAERSGSTAPLVLAQQTFDPPPTGQRGGNQRPPRRGGSSHGLDPLVGFGIGFGVGIAIDALTRPRDDGRELPPLNPPPDPGQTRQPPRNPIVYVSLPNPAPLPPPRPLTDAAAAGGQPPGEFRAGEVMVSLDLQAGADAPAQIAQDFNLLLLRETLIGLTGQRLVVYTIPDPRSVDEVETALTADPRPGAVQKNFVYRLGGEIVRGSMAAGQYALRAMHVAAAHEMARGRGVTIAVIDSAVASDHPEFAGAIAAAYDAAGYGLKVPEPHGTSVAGIIAARGGLVGVAPEARLLAVRAFWREGADGPVTSSSEVIARAIDWAVANGAQVLNLSFTGPRDALVARLLEEARKRGAIAVAAAGNNGPGSAPLYPAALEGVIAVTATDSRDALFAKANRGSYVDIAAPGVDILSPAPNADYQVISGTSMATAHISGLAALLIETQAQRQPDADVAIGAIAGSARDLGAPGRDPEFGAGLADAEAMLTNGATAAAARAR